MLLEGLISSAKEAAATIEIHHIKQTEVSNLQPATPATRCT